MQRTDSKPPRLAIVGMGPRGLAALEHLLRHIDDAPRDCALELLLFDSDPFPGAGPNYRPTQARTNRLNIPLRELPFDAGPALSRRLSLTAFPSFHDWCRDHEPAGCSDDSLADQKDGQDDGQNEDHYPPRALIGTYLQARLQHLLDGLRGQWPITLLRERVVRAEPIGKHWRLHTSTQRHIDGIDELLLAVGHLDTPTDDTLEAWRTHAQQTPSVSLFPAPYPVEPLVAAPEISKRSVVALRGMGLSMLDVMKALTAGRGGRFDRVSPGHCEYQPSGREPACLIPFSLDGLPMAPKPLNAGLDARYAPGTDALEALAAALESCIRDGGQALLTTVQTRLAALGVRAYIAHRDASPDNTSEDLEALAIRWFRDPGDSTVTDALHVLDTSLPTAEQMQRFLSMAIGATPPTLDYCLGQSWRHAQHTLFRCLAHRGLPVAAIDEVIELHQRMKRYAFGPPVDSIREALALHDAGRLRFEVCDDPAITPVASGWCLSESGDRVVADTMIDTVLDGPVLTAVDDQLVNDLTTAGHLVPVARHLGASTRADGLADRRSAGNANGSDAQAQRPVESRPVEPALIGRLAQGSIIEADSLGEAFGRQTAAWAEAAWRRVENDD